MSLSVRLRRVAYRVAYRVLQCVWFVTRPPITGVKCLITDRDRILLVRHTYGRRSWDLPGGTVKRNESPAQAAGREMDEELGLSDARWVPLGEIRGRVDHRRDTIHCFGVELAEPALELDPVELAEARWFERGRLPEDVAPYVAAIVANAPRIGG